MWQHTLVTLLLMPVQAYKLINLKFPGPQLVIVIKYVSQHNNTVPININSTPTSLQRQPS